MLHQAPTSQRWPLANNYTQQHRREDAEEGHHAEKPVRSKIQHMGRRKPFIQNYPG